MGIEPLKPAVVEQPAGVGRVEPRGQPVCALRQHCVRLGEATGHPARGTQRGVPSTDWTVPTALQGDTRATRTSGKIVNPGFRDTRNVAALAVIPGVGVAVGETVV